MKYLVPETGNPSKFVIIEASGFVPENSIPLPLELYGEEDEWLVVTEVESEFGEPKKEILVNEELKAQILAERAEAAKAFEASKRLDAAISFGQTLLREFTLENIKLGITQDGMTGVVLDRMQPALIAAQTGSLYELIARLRAIPDKDKDAKYITDARILAYINKIEAYLGLPLSKKV